MVKFGVIPICFSWNNLYFLYNSVLIGVDCRFRNSGVSEKFAINNFPFVFVLSFYYSIHIASVLDTFQIIRLEWVVVKSAS